MRRGFLAVVLYCGGYTPNIKSTGMFHLQAERFGARVRIQGIWHKAFLGVVLCGGLSLGQAQVLESLVTTALASHPSTQAYRALEEAAANGVASARWQYFPTPSVAVENASTSASDGAYQGDRTVSVLRLQQPLWAGGRLDAGVSKAQASVDASQAALDEARQQLGLRVVQAYSDWVGAHLKMQTLQQGTQGHERLRDQVKRRLELGLSSESDLLLATGRLESLVGDLALARAQHDIALARLGQLLGRPTDAAALSGSIALPRPVATDLLAQLESASAKHPTVRKAQAQARIQEAVVAERRADLYPEVYLRAERQYGNHTSANAAAQSRLFVGLSSRFGAGLSGQSGIESARAQLQAALAETQVQSRNVNEQIIADHALAVASAQRMEALKASLEVATQVSDSYDRQFLAGRKTWLDVMNAARERIQTQIQIADSQATELVTSWRLLINTQGLAVAIGSDK
jgi:adhesin transport system outer membrane protein